MIKALKRVGKDRGKFDVEYKPIQIEIITDESFQMKLRMTRGKKDIEETEPIQVEKSLYSSDIQQIIFPEWRNKTVKMRCSFCLEKGIPEPKLAKLEIIKVSNQMQRATSRASLKNDQVLATCDINFTLHFGDKYRE